VQHEHLWNKIKVAAYQKRERWLHEISPLERRKLGKMAKAVDEKSAS